MKHIGTVILFLLAELSIFGPTNVSGILKNSDNVPVPYATIHIQGKATGTYSDKNGFFRISGCYENDVINISHINHKTYSFRAGSFKNNSVIKLESNYHDIDEIIVKPRKGKVPIIGCKRAIAKNPFWSMIGGEFTSLIQNPKYENYIISNIIFKVKRKSSQRSIIKVHLYKNNNGMPGQKIYTGNNQVIINEQIKDKVSYVPETKVRVPKEGIFVGYEWVGRIDMGGNLNTGTDQSFGPAIMCKRAKGKKILNRSWKSLWQVLKEPSSENINFEACIAVFLEKEN